MIQKLLRVLRSQLAFVQNLFQREPEALRCQEDERVQLEVRAKALQQQALEQEVASQRRMRVCSAHLLMARYIHAQRVVGLSCLIRGVCAEADGCTCCRSGPAGRITVMG